MPIDLTSRERNATLAGLRLLQSRILGEPFDLEGIDDIHESGGTETPLTAEEIDDLCMKVNH